MEVAEAMDTYLDAHAAYMGAPEVPAHDKHALLRAARAALDQLDVALTLEHGRLVMEKDHDDAKVD